MAEIKSNEDRLSAQEFERPALPTGLNVLTILTFIGCAIQLYTAVTGFTGAKKNYETRDEVIAKMNAPEMPKVMKGMMPSAAQMDEIFTKSYENRIPLLLLGVIAIALCFVGAMQMRKLKKQGFLLYAIGQLLPFATSILFIGMAAYSGSFVIIMSAITLLFLLLYFFQRKHVVY
jgi:hypothetical protein